MKILSYTKMNNVTGGTTEKACAYLGMAALGSGLTGNFLAFAILGTMFSLACLKGDS
ncbi:MAG: hypothetical protein QHH13_02730 [Melioribacter sp.]|uniref:hypothetical protein n=1 Tax=Rosettibacter primus TaxID=3111523 RepID=UPI00247C685C|nr:hypothetical protein [Melioribacter sp.]